MLQVADPRSASEEPVLPVRPQLAGPKWFWTSKYKWSNIRRKQYNPTKLWSVTSVFCSILTLWLTCENAAWQTLLWLPGRELCTPESILRSRRSVLVRKRDDDTKPSQRVLVGKKRASAPDLLGADWSGRQLCLERSDLERSDHLLLVSFCHLTWLFIIVKFCTCAFEMKSEETDETVVFLSGSNVWDSLLSVSSLAAFLSCRTRHQRLDQAWDRRPAWSCGVCRCWEVGEHEQS